MSGSVASGNDAVALATDGCQPLIGFPAGAIALLFSGDCDVTVQAAQAQAAGAVGVIITNSAAGPAPPLTGAAPSITIPVVSVSQTYGTVIFFGLPSVGRLFREGDVDGNGHGDATDNCSTAANSDQADLDADGTGDACDDDDDGDGVLEGDDDCPTTPGGSDNGCPLPIGAAQCRRGGWMSDGTTFAKQAACIRYVNTGIL